MKKKTARNGYDDKITESCVADHADEDEGDDDAHDDEVDEEQEDADKGLLGFFSFFSLPLLSRSFFRSSSRIFFSFWFVQNVFTVTFARYCASPRHRDGDMSL